MKYRKLGTTNIDVSVICLGTMTFGEQNSQIDGFQQMDYALDRGINFFDTAELYPIQPRKETYGRTEKIIGNWLKERKNRGAIMNEKQKKELKEIGSLKDKIEFLYGIAISQQTFEHLWIRRKGSLNPAHRK